MKTSSKTEDKTGLSRHLTESLRLIGTQIVPTIWQTQSKSVLTFQASVIKSCKDKCDRNMLRTDRQTNAQG